MFTIYTAWDDIYREINGIQLLSRSFAQGNNTVNPFLYYPKLPL